MLFDTLQVRVGVLGGRYPDPTLAITLTLTPTRKPLTPDLNQRPVPLKSSRDAAESI